MNFEFATAQRIIFGNGCVNQLPDIIQNLGKRIVLITGRHNQLLNPVITNQEVLSRCEIKSFICDSEPSIIYMQSLVSDVRSYLPDMIISIGGGSVIDAGKVLAILAANEGNILDFIEVIGRGLPFTNGPIPFIAIPTTAGTGSEVTRNAVLYDEKAGIKASLRSLLILPKIAMIDPDLTIGLTSEVTAYTGMDAITQVIEPLLTRKANPVTDAICRHAVSIAPDALLTAFQYPENIEAREKMALVSMFGGMALANSGLGVVHGFAAAIGGMYPNLRHGQICAALLPASIYVNRKVCNNKPDYKKITQRFSELDILLGGNNQIHAEESLRFLNQKLSIQGIAKLGIKKQDYPEIVAKTQNSSSIKGNPVILSSEELITILEISE